MYLMREPAPVPGYLRPLSREVVGDLARLTMCSSIIRRRDLDLTGALPRLVAAEPGVRLPTFHEDERTLIERVLRVTRGNKLHAARELGISREALYARMARYALMGLV